MVCTLGQRRSFHVAHQLCDVDRAIHCVVQCQTAAELDSIGVWLLVEGKTYAVAFVIYTNPGELCQFVETQFISKNVVDEQRGGLAG